MTNEDRELLDALRRQHSDLHGMLERLNDQLSALEARLGFSRSGAELPPIPPEAFLPPVPRPGPELPPVPVVAPAAVELPPVPTSAPAGDAALQWFIRIGLALFAVLMTGLISVAAVEFDLPAKIGRAGELGVLGFVSMVFIFFGRSRRGQPVKATFLQSCSLVAGLAGLALTAYCAHFDNSLRVIGSPVAGVLLLLLCALYTLLLAERRASQGLGMLGLIFGYVATSLSTDSMFGMGANLVLSATAAVFLLRCGWTGVATVSALGTYLAMFHRLIFDSYGDLVLDTSRTLPFLPPAVYLTGTWVIFTAAVILTQVPTFCGVKRILFTSLNNASAAFLLVLTTYIAGYGLDSIGWTLFDTGVVFLITSRLAAYAEVDPVDLMGAYAAQGIALFTAGIIVVFTGVTRAVVLLVETLLFGVAGAFADDRILTVSTYIAGFFATAFSIWQIAVYAHHPWLLGAGGALVMLINAWVRRSDVRDSRIARTHTVVSTTCYCLFALGLIFAALSVVMTDDSLPVALALGALALTFVVYQFSIYELPALAQLLMLVALVLVLFPVETGEELPTWTLLGVAAATLILVTWWSRQQIMLPGAWVGPISYVYALALVYLAVLAVHPYLDAGSWMAAAAVLSSLFLTYGAMFRVWPVALAGQVLLALSLYHFFFPPQTTVYPWSWPDAAVPVIVTFASARAAHLWLRPLPRPLTGQAAVVSFLAYAYKLLAVAGVMRWIFGVLAPDTHLAAFFFFGTLLVGANVRSPDSFGARASLLLNAVGLYLCLVPETPIVAWSPGFAIALFFLQTLLLHRDGPLPLTAFERIIVNLCAVLSGWIFVSAWAWPVSTHHSHLSEAWAVYALAVFLFGLIVRRASFTWLGVILLFCSIFHALCFDLWTLSLPGQIFSALFLLLMLAVLLGLVVWRVISDLRKQSKNL